MIKEPQIVVHKGHEPDFLCDLLDADILPGEDGAQVDLATTDADTTAGGDGDSGVVGARSP